MPKSIHEMTSFELGRAVWDEEIENQEIFDQAVSMFIGGNMRPWELRNLLASMQDKDSLRSPLTLACDNPEIRECLFSELRQKLGMGLFYWEGYPEARDPFFASLVQDISNQALIEHLEDRAISALGMLVLSNGSGAHRVRDIATAFLNFPGPENNDTAAYRELIHNLYYSDPKRRP